MGTDAGALPPAASEAEKAAHYEQVIERICAYCSGEEDLVAVMATISCELHHAFEYFHWTGFYRFTEPDLLVIGPYQGGHGCLRIPFKRGVCGAAARTLTTQLVPDVHAFPGHIACASSTLSEVVVPVVSAQTGALLAVLDVDSDLSAVFSAADVEGLERVAALVGNLPMRYQPA